MTNTTDTDRQIALYREAGKAINDNQAYIILDGARVVAKITLKYTDQRCTAYLWIEGVGISKGHASGGGYDRASAALRKAALAAPECIYRNIEGYQERRASIINALLHDDGERWHEHLFRAGFTNVSALCY